ncbi:MAG TPA: LysR family transcriptional regulator [Pseudorhodoplanes sp.]|nr:LysR family transcriptional regulator [Pseudorhodoplanes sp.]
MDVLDLKLLETFIVLSQTRSFRGAAARLNTTQPAISNRLRRLERSLGVRLLERTKRSCQLTARGRSLLSHAERLFSVATELRTNVAEADSISGLLKIGVVETIALTWLPNLIAEAARRMPRLQLQIDVDLSVNLARKLQFRELDIGCIVEPNVLPGIAVEPLTVLDMEWVIRGDLAAPDLPLTPDTISELPIILHTGSRHAPVVEEWLRQAKTPPRAVLGCNSLAAIVKLTLAGAGLSLVPAGAVANEIASGQLRFLKTRDRMPVNPFVIAYPQAHTDYAVRAIIDLTKEVVARHRLETASATGKTVQAVPLGRRRRAVARKKRARSR